ncbi:hypothetical protein [Caballeronia insecticola]|uniref:Uncharacterized protein n=1 Tax=Caballeronia insecticola TaxID=758793 RepID=R4WTM6_9BURK|nr:hypothetical protein [Caballeronia insecticola]BAN27978.1 putative uncharacterized protein [Caballeronia insecticola]
MNTQLSERCRASLFRVRMTTPAVVAFVLADSRDSASRKVRTAMAMLYDVPLQESRVEDVRSFATLMRAGVSEDRDLRVFEDEVQDGTVSAWITAPLFLTNDTSLLGKWAELYADLATQAANAAIRRAK